MDDTRYLVYIPRSHWSDRGGRLKTLIPSSRLILRVRFPDLFRLAHPVSHSAVPLACYCFHHRHVSGGPWHTATVALDEHIHLILA